MGVLFGWGFGTFLFYKLACDAAFHGNISIIASAISAVLTVIIIFGSMEFYAWEHGKSLAKNTLGTATPSSFIENTFWFPALLALANLLSLRLIIFGFSKRLNKELFPDYRGSFLTEDFFLLLVIAATPIIIHYAMTAYGNFYHANRIAQRNNAPTEPEKKQKSSDIGSFEITQKALFSVAIADGRIDENEVITIKNILSNLTNKEAVITDHTIRNVLNDYMKDKTPLHEDVINAKEKLHREELKNIYAYSLLVALCDGDLSPDEIKILQQIASSFGLTKTERDQLLDEVAGKIFNAHVN